MRGSDDDEDTGFADFDPAQAMDGRYVSNRELTERTGDQRIHLLERHFFVSFVVQKQRAAAARVIPHDAFEYNYGAVVGMLHLFEQGCGVDWLAGDRDSGFSFGTLGFV